jgi:hypothetical protein
LANLVPMLDRRSKRGPAHAQKFGCAGAAVGYLSVLIERLKSLSSSKPLQLFIGRLQALRFHPIDWSKTGEPKGFSHLTDQLQN